MAAALVKDLGTEFENDVPVKARQLISTVPSMSSGSLYDELMVMAVYNGSQGAYSKINQ